MNKMNLSVVTNIIGAVESGGQQYGKRDYARYAPPYKNTPKEHTITLGWAQCYGHEARRLVRAIFDADTAAARAIDKNCSVEAMLAKDWEAQRWNPSEKQREVLIALIDSKIGHEQQDVLFAAKMQVLIADCLRDYPDADIKAQMMYCEIRHLGGKGPTDRIFQRCNGRYDLDIIMTALVADQRDKSSDNQVGDTRYWSRHVKCRQFIEQYAVEEEVVPMTVKIGSARGDENGKATGGKAGDQKQSSVPDYKGEVSLQDWYLHRKGWIVIRAKNPDVREKIALNMEYACSNTHIGYDQNDRNSLYSAAKVFGFDCSKVMTNVETDCSALIRVCIAFAGIKVSDFYTGDQVKVLQKTGEFDILTEDKYCKSSDYLMRGDILVTKEKGHTAAVLNNGAKMQNTPAQPALKEYIVGSCSITLKQFIPGAVDPQIKTIQRILNALGYKGKNGKKLTVDGELLENTEYAIAAFQRASGLSIATPGTVAAKTWNALLNAKQ